MQVSKSLLLRQKTRPAFAATPKPKIDTPEALGPKPPTLHLEPTNKGRPASRAQSPTETVHIRHLRSQIIRKTTGKGLDEGQHKQTGLP